MDWIEGDSVGDYQVYSAVEVRMIGGRRVERVIFVVTGPGYESEPFDSLEAALAEAKRLAQRVDSNSKPKGMGM